MRAVTKGEFAAERGVHPSRVSQWLRDGRLVELDDGRIDADAGHARLNATLDRNKGIRRTGNITSGSPGPRHDGSDPGAGPAPAGSGEAAMTPLAEQLALSGTTAQPAGAEAARGFAPGGEIGPRDRGADTDGATNEPDRARGNRSAAALLEAADQVQVDTHGGPARDDPDQAQGDRHGGQGRDDTSYWAHKAKREEYEALLAQAKYFREAGALTSAAGVRKEAMATARALRNALESIPDRIAPVLDPGSPARAHKLMLDEIRKALREFSERLGARGDAGGEQAAEQGAPVAQ